MARKLVDAELTVEEFEEHLEDEGLSDEVVENFQRNCVMEAAFLQLTEDGLRELVPLIGERTVVRELLKQSKQVIESSCTKLSIGTQYTYSERFHEENFTPGNAIDITVSILHLQHCMDVSTFMTMS